MDRSNKLILGTVQFGLPYGVNNQNGLIPESEVYKIFERAVSLGINFLDTAAAYGDAEKRIGIFKRGGMEFEVITKFSKTEGENWEKSLKDSLDKMNIEIVDTVMFHSYEAFFKNRKNLSEIIDSGKERLFKRLGVSVYNNEELLALKQVKEIEVVQLPFNLLDNEYQRGEIVEELKNSGKKIHTRSCFLQGLFFMDEKNLPGNLKPLKPWLGKIKAIAKENNIEIGHLSLQYVLNKNYVDGVLFGVDSIKQLEQNIEWTNKNLPEEIFIQIDKIKVSDPTLLNPSRWQIER
ncbi:aldo/keto reductase [Salegentibacter agarivorans]